MTQTEKILQGCGNKMPNFGDGSHTCGTRAVNPKNGTLYCYVCKAQAQTLLEAKKEEVYDDDLDYYKVAGKTSYVLKNKIDGHYVFELEYKDEDHKDYPMYIYADKGQIFYEENYEDKTIEIKKGKSIRFVTRGNIAYKMENNHLVKVEEIKDKVLLNKIKILANLEG